MKLSIIVPVYKVEEYIIKCIDSLLNQDYEDYEIIIIDDGSPDRSIQLIKERYNPLPQKITIVRQQNQGLSETRNNGLKLAHGEYVWFFDSDDWCEKNVLGSLSKYLDGSDIIYFNSFYFCRDDERYLTSRHNSTRSGKELSSASHVVPAQFYIYKKAFFESTGLKFEKGILHEDTLFVPCILYLAQSVRPCDMAIYNLYRRSGSITQTLTPKHCNDLIYVIEKLYTFYNEKIEDSDKKKWSHNISSLIMYLFEDCMRSPKSVQKDVQKWLKSNKPIVNLLKYSDRKPTRIFWLITNSFRLPLLQTYNLIYWVRYGGKRPFARGYAKSKLK